MSDSSYLPASYSPPPGAGVPSGGPGVDSRRAWSRAGGAVLLIAVLVVALSWHAIDHKHRQLAAGTVENVDSSLTTPHHASVRLPWGTLALGTTDPRTSLPHDVREYQVGGDVRPPDGGHFVGVSWSMAVGARVAAPQLTSGSGHRTQVALITDGHRYPLAPASAGVYCASVCIGPYGANRAWVAVDGAGDDARIAVSYAGVTQTVDMANGRVDRGRAGGLYSPASTHGSCGTPTWTTHFAGKHATCDVTTVRTAYVDGLGWAPAGRDWLTASFQLFKPYSVSYRAAGHSASFYTNAYPLAATFAVPGGTRVADQVAGQSDGALGGRALGGSDGLVVVFSVPAGSTHLPVTATATWGLDSRSNLPTTAATSEVTATWTVTS